MAPCGQRVPWFVLRYRSSVASFILVRRLVSTGAEPEGGRQSSASRPDRCPSAAGSVPGAAARASGAPASAPFNIHPSVRHAPRGGVLRVQLHPMLLPQLTHL